MHPPGRPHPPHTPYLHRRTHRLPCLRRDAPRPRLALRQVRIKRSIGIKKDEYFVDGKHVSKTEVASLLESAGFSRSNPYNVVPQNKVTTLTTMKPEQRLDLFKEIAGTRIYDDRRQESLAIMNETSARRDKTEELLGHIETRLKELDEEQEELTKYQDLDKRRKVAEYTYYEKERQKAKAELDKMGQKRNEDRERVEEQQQREADAKAKVKEAEKKLKELASELGLLQSECRSLTEEHKKLLEGVARREMGLQQAEEDAKAREEAGRATKREMKGLEQQITAAQAELGKHAPDCEAKVEAATRLASQLQQADDELQQLDSKQARTTQFGSRQERDKHLNKEAAELRARIKKSDQQAATLQKDLDQVRAKQGESERSADEGRKRLEAERAKADEARAACTALRQERDAATDRRKEVWRKEQQLGESLKTTVSDLDKAHRTLQHSMSRSQWEAIDRVKQIAAQQNIKGLHGTLIELFDCDPKFFTAVEVAAGNQLFQVVVDNDDVAAKLLTELQRANAGRVTFMPLNRLRPGPDPAYPETEDAIPMISRLKFKDMFKPAFQQVFRKSLVVRSLDVGSRFSKSHDLDCVTLDGDQVNRKGALTGGYLDARRSRLQAQADVARLTSQKAAYEAQLEGEKQALGEVDAQVTRLLGELKKKEAERQKAEAAAEQEALDLPTAAAGAGAGAQGAGRAAERQKEEALAALKAAAQAERARLEAVTAEAGSEFTDGLNDGESRRRSELQASLAKLKKQVVAAEREKNKVEQKQKQRETELREHLLKRKEELAASLAADEQEGSRAAGEGTEEQLEAAKQKLGAVEAQLRDKQQEREQKAGRDRALQKQAEEYKAQLAQERQQQQDEAKELDKSLARKAMLTSKQEEYTECIRKLGTLPKDAFDADRTQSSKQLMATIEKCQAELSKLSHVNKKARDQYANFSEQRDKLLERQVELDESQTAINELIEHLDHKKDEALTRTFKMVAKNFTEVFSELVPGGTGKLIMQSVALDDDAPAAGPAVASYSGVKVHVSFTGGGDTQTMEQLSGGQKTMTALCLIFAIQRCDPAPFYIFDEVDANLDATHRAALAKMIERQAADVGEDGRERTPTQFITTTFRPELIHAGDQFYGVTHVQKASKVTSISKEEALRIITETSSRQRQHVGGARN